MQELSYIRKDKMSTKIYNGYRFTKNYGFMELKERLDILKKVMIERLTDKYCELAATRACIELDLYYYDKELYQKYIDDDAMRESLIKTIEDPKDVVINAIWNDYNLFRQAYMGKNDENYIFDFKTHLIIFPLKDTLLFQAFTGGPIAGNILSSVLSNQPDIEEYCYWNNTEYPEELTEEEWNQREMDWNYALSSEFHTIPALCGFTVDLFHDSFFPLSTGEIFANRKCPMDIPQRVESLYAILKKYGSEQDLEFKENIRDKIIKNTYLETLK